MAMNADDLYQEIIDAEKDYTKTFLESEDESKSDDELVKSGKCRVVFDGENKILDFESMKSADYVKVLGDVIVKHVKDNAEFEWSYSGTITYQAGTSTSTSPDSLTKVTGKIQSIQNTMKGPYASLELFLKDIVDAIRTAVIDIDEPDIFFNHSSMDEFGQYTISYTPGDSYENNMKLLASAIVQYTKSALSTKSISCTHTDTTQYPTALSSSGTAKMTKIE